MSSSEPSTAPAPSAIAGKLRIRPSAVLCVIGAPAEHAQLLDPLPVGTVRRDMRADDPAPSDARTDARADVVLAYASDAAALAGVAPRAIATVRRDGLLWIAYPKGGAKAGTDLNRDLLHDAVERVHGWTGVSLVALDARWSAMRFRPTDLVGT